MKKWMAVLLVGLLLAGLVLLLIHPIRELAESLQALRAASPDGEAAGNAVLVDPLIVAAVPAALVPLLWFLISRIGRNRGSTAEKMRRELEKLQRE